MRRAQRLMALALAVAVAALAGCGGAEDRIVVRVIDSEGVAAPREVTVRYVNDRLDRLPPQMLPEVGGEEGKREFIDEIVRKELLVVLGHRLGFQNDPDLEEMLALYETDKAWQVYQARQVYEPAEPTDQDLQQYNVVRGTTFELQQIAVAGAEDAVAARRRVTSGGEDFAAVAVEVSASPSSEEGGVLPSQLWQDLHPVIGDAVFSLGVGDVSEVIDMGDSHHIYKVLSRIEPADPGELEGQRLRGITEECRTYRRMVRQHEVNKAMLTQANLRYSDDGLDLATERLGEKAALVIPEDIMELDIETRMNIAKIPIVPEFDDEESEMEFLTYNMRGHDDAWTLGDLRGLIESTSPLEAPKSGDVERLKGFIWRHISNEMIEDEIEQRGYRDDLEVRDYVHMRAEEYVVQRVYQTEVMAKIVQPTGSEIREYFQTHRDDYMSAEAVDARILVVDTEAEANQHRQRLIDGQDDFVDLVRAHSVNSYTKNRDGLVRNYLRGEGRLDFLQDVVFDLEEGEISEPFRAPGGYALATVESKRPSIRLTFDQAGHRAKEYLVAMKNEERLNQLLDELRETVTIEWLDENLVHIEDPAEARAEKESGFGVVSP